MLCAAPRAEASASLRVAVDNVSLACDNSTAAGVAACFATGFQTVLGSNEITLSNAAINLVFVRRISVNGNNPGTPSIAFMLGGETWLQNLAGVAKTVTVDFAMNNFTLPVGSGSLLASQTANWSISGNGDSQTFAAWLRNDNSLAVPGSGASGASVTTPDCVSPGGLSQTCGSQSSVIPATTTAPFALTGQAVVRLSAGAVGSFTTSSLITTSSNPVVASDAAISLTLERQEPRQFLYTIAVTNGGPAVASAVTVTDAIPTGTKFVSAVPSQGNCVTPPPGAVGTMTCNLGSVAAGAEATVKLLVDVTATGLTRVTNTAVVSSSSSDLNTANNRATLENQWGEPR